MNCGYIKKGNTGEVDETFVMAFVQNLAALKTRDAGLFHAAIAATTAYLRRRELSPGLKALFETALGLASSRNAEERANGLHALEHFFREMHEESARFLPEAVTTLSECLEDVDERVEAAARECIRVLEAATGEDLSLYLQ